MADTEDKPIRAPASALSEPKYDEKPAEEPAHFKSRLGLVLSCLGCVVGTGNIWRFPRIVANNSQEGGGLAFLLVWLLFLLLWSIPMLMTEYALGRYTRKAVIGAFKDMLGERALWCGAWVSLVSFMISAFYAVVLGWCFYYFYYCLAHDLPTTVTDSRLIFKEFAEDSYWPVLTHGMAVVFAGLAVVKGVSTIEKVNSFLVPIFLLLLLITFIWSLTREYASEGITYLFSPSWDSLKNPRLWVDALSQNAFDTGAGSGLLVPYASYMTADNNIVQYATFIPTTNNFVSLVAGMTVMSTVFSTLILTRPLLSRSDIINVLKDSGPGSTGLTFIWVPVLFSTIGTFGRVLSVLFFLCLSFAGITSLISNMELVAHTLQDFGLSRKFGTPLTVVVTFLVGLMSALNINILTNQDFVWGFALVVNGLMFQAMLIIFGVSRFRRVAINDYSWTDWKLPVIWEWIVKYVAPLEAVAMIVWWAIDLISDEAGEGEKWYQFGRETFMVTIVQWVGAMVALVLINVAVCRCSRRLSEDREGLVGEASVLDSLDKSYGSNQFSRSDSNILDVKL